MKNKSYCEFTFCLKKDGCFEINME